MWDPDRQSLANWIQDAYEIVVEHVDEPDESIPVLVN